MSRPSPCACGAAASDLAPARPTVAASGFSPRLPTRVARGLIRLYQIALSPWLGAHCRFYPSCSTYALQAIERFGCWRGGWLSLKRIGRCHPWHPGGVDLVPEHTHD